MEEPQVYKLYLQPGLKMMLWVMLVMFVGVGIFLLGWRLSAPGPKAPPLAVALIWLAVVGFNLYWVLTIPHQITLAPDGSIEFISLLRRRRVRADEIKSIKPESSRYGFLLVRTDRVKIRLLAQFDGFHDFLTRLKALHPGVELRGC